MLSDDLRDIDVGVRRVYVEVLRDHYTRRSGISFWLGNRFRLWFFSSPSLNCRSGLINLNFGARQVLKDALLRRNLHYRLRLPLKSIVVKRVLRYSLYLREISRLLIAYRLLERSTEKVFREYRRGEIVVRQLLTLLELWRAQYLGFELAIQDLFFHHDSPQVFLELSVVKGPAQLLSNDLSRMIDA